jgi:hypothetical protein
MVVRVNKIKAAAAAASTIIIYYILLNICWYLFIVFLIMSCNRVIKVVWIEINYF